MATDPPERILFTVWPLDEAGADLPGLYRLIEAVDYFAAAREFVEQYADHLDWDEPFTLAVRRVRDPNQRVHRVRVTVPLVPVGDGIVVREEVGRG